MKKSGEGGLYWYMGYVISVNHSLCFLCLDLKVVVRHESYIANLVCGCVCGRVCVGGCGCGGVGVFLK